MRAQEWEKRVPTCIKKDVRDKQRQLPSLNLQNGVVIETVEDCLAILTPDGWYQRQLDYTNPKLLGTSKHNKKLTLGELKKWWGYALALTIHDGIPLNKMWSDTPTPKSLLPPPRMGRHGMSLKRFKKIRAVLTFGPEDKTSLRADNWAFIRWLIDKFNSHRLVVLSPGWLLTMDELMVAWRGQQGAPCTCPLTVRIVPNAPAARARALAHS